MYIRGSVYTSPCLLQAHSQTVNKGGGEGGGCSGGGGGGGGDGGGRVCLM